LGAVLTGRQSVRQAIAMMGMQLINAHMKPFKWLSMGRQNQSILGQAL
jgi:hypothetical protein